MLKNIPTIITILLLAIICDVQAQDNTIDLVLLAGQSNMKGQGVWADIAFDNHLADSDPNVMMIQNGSTGETRIAPFKELSYHITNNSVLGGDVQSFGMAIPLARNLYDAGHEKLAIINGAVGGSNILDWQKGDLLYDNFLGRIQAGIAGLENAGFTVNILGFAWQQGEKNNNDGTPSAEYLAALTTMIASLKDDMDIILPSQGSTMKSVLMEPVYGNENQTVIPLVADAMIDYVSINYSNTAYIETRDITDRIALGNIHWGTVGVTTAGNRLAISLIEKRLEDPNLTNFITSPPDWDGIWIKDFGTSQEFNTGILPFIDISAGDSGPLRWEDMEEAPQDFNFSKLRSKLERCIENNNYYIFELWTGNRSPEWIYEQGGVTTFEVTSGGVYPNYKSEAYKFYLKRFYNALADEIASYPPDLRGRLAFLMPGFGATGDRQLYKDEPIPEDAEYGLTDEEWLDYMQEMTTALTNAFWGNIETANFRFRWNIDDYNGEPEVINPNEEQIYGAWVKENYNAQIRKQQFTIAIGHMAPNEKNQDEEQRDNFFGNNPDRWDGNPEYVIGEIQEERFATTPLHIINPELNYLWTAISSVDRGLDGWDLKYSFIDEAYLEAYEFSERYSFNKKAETSPVAFIVLRDVLDYSDEVRFPAADYGDVERENEDRIDAILTEFSENYGAANDDNASVIDRSGANYIQNATGFNDCTWNVIDRNYRRFITQINPNTTSKGYWRVGLNENGEGGPYGRFARGFDLTSSENAMYFDVDDAYFLEERNNGDGTLKLRVVYYAADGGSWDLVYHAQDGTMRVAAYTTNPLSGGWSEATVEIQDALLDNGGFNGADIILQNKVEAINTRFHLIELDSGVDTVVEACTSTTTFTSSGWDNGLPNAATSVIISEDYNTNVQGSSIDACELRITNDAKLRISPEDYAKVKGNITVDAGSRLVVTHQGSLVQVDDDAVVINNGVIEVLVTTPVLKPRDFIVSGSPMTNDTRDGVYGAGYTFRNHNTLDFFPHPDVIDFYAPNEVANFVDDNFNDWIIYNGGVNPTEGYLVRPQANPQDGNTAYDLVFNQGTLNNGVLSYAMDFHIDKNSSPNILSNPYASAIDAEIFLNENPEIDELYFWEHITTPSGDFPGGNTANFSMEDISMYNRSGGIGAGKAATNGGTTPNGIIATSQGFGVKASVAGTATFNNAMRVTTGNNTLRSPQVNSDRVWLQIESVAYGLSSETLIAFKSGATEFFDPGYDSEQIGKTIALYSHLPDGQMSLGIQGREAFNEEIQVPMGYASQIDESTEFKINIKALEGLALETEQLFLIDTLFNTITNLSETGEYLFVSAQGNFPNRFILQFKDNEVLGANDGILSDISIVPNPTGGAFTIHAASSIIYTVTILDIQGRTIRNLKGNDTSKMSLNISDLNTAVYFVAVETDNGTQILRLIRK